MKKILGISLFLFLVIFACGCGTGYVMSGAVTNETNAKNYYQFAAFKGTYTFDKSFSEDTKVRIVTYTEKEEVMKIYIKQNGEVVKELDVSKDNNGTYYVDLVKGDYEFSFSSSVTYKAELTFDWKGE